MIIGLAFICEPCKEAGNVIMDAPPEVIQLAKRSKHNQCVGGTHCDCQHRVKRTK